MSVNDSTLATVARKLHGLSDHKELNDPVELEKLLNLWWDRWLRSNDDSVPELGEEGDEALNNWLRAKYIARKQQ